MIWPYSSDFFVPFSSGNSIVSDPLIRSRHLLRNRFGLQKEQKIIRSTGLGICSRHIEAAEGMRAHHSAGALAVHIEIPYEKLISRLADMLGICGIDCSGQSILGVIGHLESMLEIPGFRHRQNRSEDLLLKDTRLGID